MGNLNCPEDFSCAVARQIFTLQSKFFHFNVLINTLDGESEVSQAVPTAKAIQLYTDNKH